MIEFELYLLVLNFDYNNFNIFMLMMRNIKDVYYI